MARADFTYEGVTPKYRWEDFSDPSPDYAS